MPWVAPAVGYIDRRGALRCITCAEAVIDALEPEGMVWGDQHFGADDICCQCGSKMKHITSSGYVQVPW